MEDALGIFGVVDAERHRDAFHWFVPVGRGVGTHQDLVADHEAGMHDLVPPLGRRLPLHWRAPIRHHRDDLAAETPLIELERNLAITVEGQIRAQLHGVLLWCSRIERKVLAVTVSWRAFSSRLRSHPDSRSSISWEAKFHTC